MDTARDRASKLAIILFSFIAFIVVSGCDLFGRAGADGGPGPDPDDANGPAPAWTLGPVSRGPHHPGTWLTFVVDGIDAPAADVFLWVVEDESAFPLRAMRSGLAPPEPGFVSDDDAGPLDDAGRPIAPDGGMYRSATFALPLPIVRAGVFHLAVGTAEGPMTRAAEVEVALGGASMTRTEAADVIALGLAGMVTDVGEILRDDDPEWQSLASEPALADTIGAFESITEDLDEAAMDAREQYLALDASVEPGVQELLWNSGMLSTLAARASGVSMLTFGGGMLDSALVRSPLQGVLFTLDAISMLLAVFGIACDVIAIVGTIVTLPAGGEGCLIGLAPKMIAAVLRVVIDNIVPTDLVRIFDVHRSRVVYGTEGSMVVPWGVFAPQNRTAGANVRSLEDIVLAMMPIQPTRGVRQFIEEVGEYLITHLPGVGFDAWFNRIQAIPHVEIALPLDMGFYNIQLSQVLRLNPAFVGLAAGVEALHDPEIVSPYTASFARTGGRVTVGYDTRSVGFTDLSWPSTAPTARTAALLEIRAFAFASSGPEALDVQLVQIPLPYASRSQAFFQVQQAVDPADRNAAISDEDFIELDVNLIGGGTTRIVRDSTTTTRVHPLVIDDNAGGRFDQAMVDILVNGAPQFTGQVVPDGTVLSVPLTLQPGVNDVEVVSTAGHSIGCGPSSTDPVCLEITFSDADNVNSSVRLLGAVGTRRSFRVWTPPTFPPPEE